MTDGIVPRPTLAAKILTVSDGVHDGTRDDASGRALVARLTDAGFDVQDHRVTADGAGPVADAVAAMADGFWGLLVTTGGTGFGPRDETPEGTLRILERRAPGLEEAMRLVNPLGRLSRGVAGTSGRTLVLNVVGSTRGAIEMLDAVIDVVPHAIALMVDNSAPHPRS